MKFGIVAAILSLLVVAALGTSIPSSAQEERQDAKDLHQGTLTEFDVPGANLAPGLGTQALANNDFGEVVGFYTDMNVVPHGFIRAFDGKITTFDAPGAPSDCEVVFIGSVTSNPSTFEWRLKARLQRRRTA